MTLRAHLVRLSILVAPSLACLAQDAPPTDGRLARARNLDDYHPWTPLTDPAAWKARAQRVREQILVAAGLWPMPPAAPLEPVIHGAIDRGDYTVEKVFFRSYPGFYVTGNLYRPKAPAAGRRAAVLFAHGHWRNGRFHENGEDAAKKELEIGAEKWMAGARYLLQAPCAMLARMGCVVFTFDMVGYADSTQIKHTGDFCDAEAGLRLQSSFGLQAYNCTRAFDFLASLPEVDPGRIGITGASGGGTQTFILCGIDDRPAVAFPAVMVSTAMQGGCICENAPLLRVGTGNIELAALTAPRPLGMTGANDWTIDIEKKGLPELKALYTALGIPDLVDAKCYPQFEHNYNQVSRERMYAWMNRHLKLGLKEPIEERPFEPIPPAELSVFDKEHPRPNDAADAATLRRTLTALSDRQMAELEPRDAASLKRFQDVMRGALRAIVVSELPAKGTVTAAEAGSPTKRRDATVRKLILTRRGTDERVPALLATPVTWNGSIVVWVDGRGKDAAFGGAAVDQALSRGAAVLAPDVFLMGELLPASGKAEAVLDRQHKSYHGYTYGYNRTTLANRVHDVLTAIGTARDFDGAKRVLLLGAGDAGLWAILALALADGAVERTVAEAPDFDFADIADSADLRFLPGAVKYGGWGAFAATAAPAELCLAARAPPDRLSAAYSLAGAVAKLTRDREAIDSGRIADLLR